MCMPLVLLASILDPLQSLSPTTVILLVLISLVGGIGITAIGPGGVLVTIGLFAFTDLSPAEVAGTAIVTHIGTGIVGSLAFLRSGQLGMPRTRRLALVLSVVAIACTPIGVLINARVSGRQFGIMLAAFVMLVGASVIVREIASHRRRSDGDQGGPEDVLSQSVLGGVVAVVSGVFGLGGPMISVPIMVIVGYPILVALAAAQAQSIVIAGTGTVSYFLHGSISWPLVVITGVPEMIGVCLGWKIAHAVPTRPLKLAMATSLVLLGPVLLVNG
jgi:uncharacterized membrane protein YfcA